MLPQTAPATPCLWHSARGRRAGRGQGGGPQADDAQPGVCQLPESTGVHAPVVQPGWRSEPVLCLSAVHVNCRAISAVEAADATHGSRLPGMAAHQAWSQVRSGGTQAGQQIHLITVALRNHGCSFQTPLDWSVWAACGPPNSDAESRMFRSVSRLMPWCRAMPHWSSNFR